jgi:hypothetical protein
LQKSRTGIKIPNEEHVKKALDIKLPAVDVEDETLLDEFGSLVQKNRAGNHKLIAAFNALNHETQAAFLRVAARLKEHRAQNGGGSKSMSPENMLEFHNDQKSYLDFKIIKWLMVMFAGMFMLFLAKNHIGDLAKEYGLDSSYAWAVLKDPGKGGTDTVASVMIELMNKMRDEAMYEIGNVCGDPRSATSGGITQNIQAALSGVVTFFAGSGSANVRCVTDVFSEATRHTMEMEAIRINTTVSHAENLVYGARFCIATSSAKITEVIYNRFTGTKRIAQNGNHSRAIIKHSGGGNTRRLKRRRTRGRRRTRRGGV